MKVELHYGFRLVKLLHPVQTVRNPVARDALSAPAQLQQRLLYSVHIANVSIDV